MFIKRSLCSALVVGSLISAIVPSAMAANNGSAKVRVTFCNDEVIENHLFLPDLEVGEEREFCIEATNVEEDDVFFTMYFVDASINNGKYIACQDEFAERTNFSKFAYFEEGEHDVEEEDNGRITKMTFTVPGKTKVRKTGKVNFSGTYSGMSYGCLISMTGKQEKNKSGGASLNVVLRRANTIKANVGGEIKVGMGITNGEKDIDTDETLVFAGERMTIVKDEKGRYFIKRKYENQGNVEMEVTERTLVTNMFGFEYLIEAAESILPKENKSFKREIKNIPFYKSKFNVESTVIYKPVFEFESDKITDEMRKEIEHKDQASFFIFPTLLFISVLGALTVIIIIIIMIVHHRRKINAAKEDYIVKKDDTLNSIADDFACNWKQIATINKIKAPYILKDGQEIVVLNFKKK